MKDFDVNDGGEWFLVHSGAATNTNPGSMGGGDDQYRENMSQHDKQGIPGNGIE